MKHLSLRQKGNTKAKVINGTYVVYCTTSKALCFKTGSEGCGVLLYPAGVRRQGCVVGAGL